MDDVEYFAVATRDDIEPGEVFVSVVEGTPVAICNVDGVFYAIKDACTHDGSSFDTTDLEGPEIFCPRHGAVFNVITGEVLGAPATVPVPTFPVRMNGDTIEVGLEL
ncbi:MAG: non-heme iron oxygenase ferredoxin subunit [Chloroflexi bacterium]|nr:non-heme iron oxygenase ferredoxin subunit [Chloroflexota bacterium]